MPARKTTKPKSTKSVKAKPVPSTSQNSEMKYTPIFLIVIAILLVLLSYSTYINIDTLTKNNYVPMPSHSSSYVMPEKMAPPVVKDDMTSNTAPMINSKMNPDAQTWNSYPWKDFTINYPSNWSFREDPANPPASELMLTFTRSDSSSFDVIKGFGDYGRCLFPDEADYNTFDGMGSPYPTYEEISNGPTKWRLADYAANAGQTHLLCEYDASRNQYFSKNAFGIHNVNLLTPDAKYEFIQILKQSQLN